METTKTNKMFAVIKNYEGKYLISNYGDILNTEKAKYLKTTLTREGYYRVTLSLCGYAKQFLVNRLVAESFIRNPEKKPYVNHKDGNN